MTEDEMVGWHHILSGHRFEYLNLLLSPSPPTFKLPSIRVFSNELALRIRWPKYWSFSISPSNEYSGLISFRMDWLDLLAVQGILMLGKIEGRRRRGRERMRWLDGITDLMV